MAERNKPKGERPRDDRPKSDRSSSGRPPSDRSSSGRPPSGRPSGGRPVGGNPQSGKPGSSYGRPTSRSGGPPSGYRSSAKPTSRPPSDRQRKPPYEGAERPRTDRPPTDRPRPSYQDQRPRSGFQRDDRPRDDRGGYDRGGFDRPRDDRGGYDRPRDDRGGYDRGGFDRSRDDRAGYDRPRDDRSPYSRPRPQGQYGDRPRDDRPRDDRPRDDRPYSARPRPASQYGDRPRRPPFDPRRPYTARPAYNARPQREPVVDRDALVGDGEELIAGRRPVEEAFAARREAVRLLIVPERRAALDALAIHATTLRIPVVEVEGGSLTALAGFDGHQGVALVARPRPAGDVDAILARARERGEAPFVLVLDSLEDPQNFGTLLRSAEACGAHGVIYPTRRSAPLSPAAIKASAGATEHLILAAVDDLAGTLADLHGDGLRVVGADEDASLAYTDADLRGPLAVVVGSEGRGMSGPVHRRLDLTVRIPMRGKIESLNAAVAGSILLFAAAGQRPAPAADPAQASATSRSELDASDESSPAVESETRTNSESEPKARKKAASKAKSKSDPEAKSKSEPKTRSKSKAKSTKASVEPDEAAAEEELLPGDR